MLEFRDKTRFNSAVYDALNRHGAALCAYEFAGTTAPLTDIAAFDDIRLHRPKEGYQGQYSQRALDDWAARTAVRLAAGQIVYCYVDNDEAGYATTAAKRMRKRLG